MGKAYLSSLSVYCFFYVILSVRVSTVLLQRVCFLAKMMLTEFVGFLVEMVVDNREG